MSKAGRRANAARDIDRKLAAFGADSPPPGLDGPSAASPALSRADRRKTKRQGSEMMLRRSLAEFTHGDPAKAFGDKSKRRMLADADRLLRDRQRRLGYRGSAAKTIVTAETAATVERITTARNPLTDLYQPTTEGTP